MATFPASSSASNSDTFAPEPKPLILPEVEVVIKKEEPDLDEKPKPDLPNPRVHLNDPARIEKYKKYEEEHAGWLVSKYFSKKDIFGDDIYETETRIGDDVLRSSRFSSVQSFADPVKYLEYKRRSASTSPSENSSVSNGNNPTKEN